ncbi:P-II family nitrogen regulator [Woodsholea maritima]|uniref:P-II family nitrogen regulator n=1 Tax=Woodsholea maritima TaxID=240237 RepID=UPI00037C9C53|nr:hypothetical protein [Woodsholea maritima]
MDMTHWRLELIVEPPVIKPIESVLTQCGVSGWTVLPALSGSGHNGAWSRKGQIIDVSQRHILVTILTHDQWSAVKTALAPVIEDNIAFASLSPAALAFKD